MKMRFQNGKLKIFKTLHRLLDEMRRYSYDEKNKPKQGQDDHGCDTMKYGVVSGLRVEQSSEDWAMEDHERVKTGYV